MGLVTTTGEGGPGGVAGAPIERLGPTAVAAGRWAHLKRRFAK